MNTLLFFHTGLGPSLAELLLFFFTGKVGDVQIKRGTLNLSIKSCKPVIHLYHSSQPQRERTLNFTWFQLLKKKKEKNSKKNKSMLHHRKYHQTKQKAIKCINKPKRVSRKTGSHTPSSVNIHTWWSRIWLIINPHTLPAARCTQD